MNNEVYIVNVFGPVESIHSRIFREEKDGLKMLEENFKNISTDL